LGRSRAKVATGTSHDRYHTDSRTLKRQGHDEGDAPEGNGKNGDADPANVVHDAPLIEKMGPWLA